MNPIGKMPRRAAFIAGLVCSLAVASALAAPAFRPIADPLKALPGNPNYFADGNGRAVYLTGSHTWNTFQDWGTDGVVEPLDFDAFVTMLGAHHHNFTLLWITELPTFHGLPTTANSPPDFTVTPFPWQRTGPGTHPTASRDLI